MKLSLKLTLKSLLTYGIILGNKIANIIYNMSDFNVTSTFFRTINNAGSDGGSGDGDAYSGNFLSLNESGRINESVPIDTPFELGGEEISGTTWAVGGGGGEVRSFTSISASAFNLAVTTVGVDIQSPNVNIDQNNTDGKTLLLSFNAVVNSGTPILRKFFTGVEFVLDHVVTNGYNEIEISGGTFSKLFLYFNGTNLFDIELTNISIKQITNPNAYLTYIDQATRKHVTIGNSVNGGSSEKILNGDLNDSINHWVGRSGITTISNDNGTLKILKHTSGGFSRVEQLQTIVSGGIYAYSIDITDMPTDVGDIFLFTGGKDNIIANFADGVGTYTGTFTAISRDTVILIGNKADVVDEYFSIDNISLVEILPISTTYDMTVSCQNIFPSTKAPIQADRDYLDNVSPEAIGNMVNGDLIPQLSFVLADLYGWYPCDDKESGQTLNDVLNATSALIVNYVIACRTDFENVNYGFLDHLFIKDASGRITGKTPANLIQHSGDDRYTDTDWIPNIGEDWSFEIVVEIVANADTFYLEGLNSNGRVSIGQETGTTRSIWAQAGTAWITTAPNTVGLHHAVVTYNASTKDVSLYVDSVLINTLPSTLTQPNATFTLGKENVSNTYDFKAQHGLFKEHRNKVYNQADVDKAYAEAKLIYPSLP